MKLVEILSGQWLEAVEDRLLVNSLQGLVAAQATVEGLDFGNQLEALDDLSELLKGVEGTQTIAKLDRLPHQQAAVARQQDTPLALNDISHMGIFVIILIQAVEPQHA